MIDGAGIMDILWWLKYETFILDCNSFLIFAEKICVDDWTTCSNSFICSVKMHSQVENNLEKYVSFVDYCVRLCERSDGRMIHFSFAWINNYYSPTFIRRKIFKFCKFHKFCLKRKHRIRCNNIVCCLTRSNHYLLCISTNYRRNWIKNSYYKIKTFFCFKLFLIFIKQNRTNYLNTKMYVLKKIIKYDHLF